MTRIDPASPPAGETPDDRSLRLEAGEILRLDAVPFEFPAEDLEFLRAQRQTGASYHKNIAYRVRPDVVTGTTRMAPADAERLRRIMRAYALGVIEWMSAAFPAYASGWRIDYASYRPIEEEGRVLSQRSRNDLLHVDAFPGRPTNGDRILRFFTNIHPSKPRVWLTGEPFHRIAPSHAARAGLRRRAGADDKPAAPRPLYPRDWADLWREIPLLLRGRKRSPYDRFMLAFHDYLKADGDFQSASPKQRWEFPAGSCWVVFTDTVPHAVLSGRFALEMTFIVSRGSLAAPDLAPVHVLERLSGYRMTLP